MVDMCSFSWRGLELTNTIFQADELDSPSTPITHIIQLLLTTEIRSSLATLLLTSCHHWTIHFLYPAQNNPR